MSRNGKRKMQRGDEPNTIQLCSKNRTESELRNSTADIRIRTLLPPPFSIPLFSRSYVIPDPWRPPAFPKQLCQISPSTHSLLPYATDLVTLHRLSPVSTRHKTNRGFPSLFLRGSIRNVWVTWHWEYSFSFHCNKLGLDTQHSQKIIYLEEW